MEDGKMHWIYAHLIGDFLIQNDWMAKGKKESSLICLTHVLTYLIPFIFVGSYMDGWKVHIVMFQWEPLYFVVVGLQHFAQDKTNIVVESMKATGKGDFAKPPMAPWSVIITDNILHILFIAWVVSV
jgi:hypothetical protein